MRETVEKRAECQYQWEETGRWRRYPTVVVPDEAISNMRKRLYDKVMKTD
jgi:hypothetical protein